MESPVRINRLEQDLVELEALLRRAESEACGRADDEIAKRLIRQLIDKRRDQLASAR